MNKNIVVITVFFSVTGCVSANYNGIQSNQSIERINTLVILKDGVPDFTATRISARHIITSYHAITNIKNGRRVESVSGDYQFTKHSSTVNVIWKDEELDIAIAEYASTVD
ncbi:MAG: hypothetical protein HQL86_07345, partial [Magnetococcales bacterium]|nr:hypothetical protein [Magnetococcales bacterium]